MASHSGSCFWGQIQPKGSQPSPRVAVPWELQTVRYRTRRPERAGSDGHWPSDPRKASLTQCVSSGDMGSHISLSGLLGGPCGWQAAIGVNLHLHHPPHLPPALPALSWAKRTKPVTGRSRPLGSEEWSLDPSITLELARNPDPPTSS